MIKFTMGSSDAKKTPRRKAKRTTGKSSYVLPSNCGVSTSQAVAVSTENGCLQIPMPTSTSALIGYSQWPQKQENQAMQKSTSDGDKDGDLLNGLPSQNVYLAVDSCCFCGRPKIGNAELNLAQFVESESGLDVSAFSQFWVCLECQQSLDRSGIDPMTGDLHEEIVLDPPSSPVIDETSEILSLNAHPCNCSSCTETRQIKEQSENFAKELQRYLYEDLRRIVACVYRSLLSSLTADSHERYQLSDVSAEKMHNVIQRLYCRDPQLLFQCLESWAEEFITERRNCLCVHIPAAGQQMTVSTAAQLISSLLDEYSCFCVVCQNLVSFFHFRENPMLNGFQMTVELHHKYLFHRLIFAELQKYFTGAVALISLQLTKLRKENADVCKSYSQLLQEYVKLQDEMSRVLMDWTEYCQLMESAKDEQAKHRILQNDTDDLGQWVELQKQTDSVQCDAKVAQNDGCICKYDVEKMLVCGEMVGSDASTMLSFPSHVLLSSGSQIIQLDGTLPSAAKDSGSSSSGFASPDENADAEHLLAAFIEGSRELVNGRIQLESKEEEDNDDEEDDEEEEEDDDEEDDVDEPIDPNNSSPDRLISELHNNSHLNADDEDDDDDNSSDEDIDEDDDDYEDDVDHHGVKDGILRIGNEKEMAKVSGALSGLGSAAVSSSALNFNGAVTVGGVSLPIGSVSIAAPVTSGKLFAFGEQQETKTPAAGSVQQPKPCQCSSCVSSSITADLPLPSLTPLISSLSIYPHIHGPTVSSLQPGQAFAHNAATVRPQQQQLHTFQIRRQQGDGLEQVAPKTLGLEPHGVSPSHTVINNWDLQNSAFFIKQSDYKILLTGNGGMPFAAIPQTTNAGCVQSPNPDDSRVWFKPTTVNPSSSAAAQAALLVSSAGLFNVNPNVLHHSVPQTMPNEMPPLFPVHMPGLTRGAAIPAAKYRADQQQYRFQLPTPVTTSASAVFSMSSSFYQITGSSPACAQPQGLCAAGSSVAVNGPSIYDALKRKPTDAVSAGCVISSAFCGSGTHSPASSHAMCNGPVATDAGGTVGSTVGSCVETADCHDKQPQLFDHCTSLGSSIGSSSVISPLIPDAMAQFNLGMSLGTSFAPVNFDVPDVGSAVTMGNRLPVTCRRSSVCQQGDLGSHAQTCSEDQQSLASGKTDSQQDEDGFNSQDESGSSSVSNQKDGKYCDCWHCEVFGHNTPLALPTSKNYPEIRDRLRLRLKKKQNELRCGDPEKLEERPVTPEPVKPPPQQQQRPQPPMKQEELHTRDIEELIKYINGEVDVDRKSGEEDMCISKSKAKAAKRHRQKLRKLQQKSKDLPKNCVSDKNVTRQEGRQKTSSHHAPCSGTFHAEHSYSFGNSSKAQLRCSQECDSNDDRSCKRDDKKLLTVLNTMKFHSGCMNKAETAKSCEAKCDGNSQVSSSGLLTDNNAVISGDKRSNQCTKNAKNSQHCTSSSAVAQENRTVVVQKLASEFLRQSSSQCLYLEKKDCALTGKTKMADEFSEKTKDCGLDQPSYLRSDSEMRPVAISSEDGMRTILASPLLQAELAKNKPLQKLFFQAVQQQQLSRERQEASAASAQLEAKSQQSVATQRISTVAQQPTIVANGCKQKPVESSRITVSQPSGAARSDGKSDQANLQRTQPAMMNPMSKNSALNVAGKGANAKQNPSLEVNSQTSNSNQGARTRENASQSSAPKGVKSQPDTSQVASSCQQTKARHNAPLQGVKAAQNTSQTFQTHTLGQEAKTAQGAAQSSNPHAVKTQQNGLLANPKIQQNGVQANTQLAAKNHSSPPLANSCLGAKGQQKVPQSKSTQGTKSRGKQCTPPSNAPRAAETQVSASQSVNTLQNSKTHKCHPSQLSGGQQIVIGSTAGAKTQQNAAIQNGTSHVSKMQGSQPKCGSTPHNAGLSCSTPGGKLHQAREQVNGSQLTVSASARGQLEQSNVAPAGKPLTRENGAHDGTFIARKPSTDQVSKCDSIPGKSMSSSLLREDKTKSNDKKTMNKKSRKSSDQEWDMCNSVATNSCHDHDVRHMDAKDLEQVEVNCQQLASSEASGTDIEHGTKASSKAKKTKKKGKAKKSLASVDEIFMPKDVPDDSHLDEYEREIEEFKRFCSNLAPSGNRQKVNLNNIKDIFNKKKMASAIN